MSFTKGPSQDQLAESGVAEDSPSLLPVLEEDEEGAAQGPALASTVTVTVAAGGGPAGSGTATLSDGSPSQPAVGTTGTSTDRSVGGAAASDSGQSEQGSVSAPSEPLDTKEDSPSVRGKSRTELSASMEAIEEQKVKEDLSETSSATEKQVETSVVSEADDSMRDEKNSLSQSDKEIETEFQRLSLGFKCDMFTLEKRLRLEERSRDLAEENVRREISSCQGLLQALTPLCEDDNQSMEIIQRLQKNLDILIQSMTRVSSRSEMLGAIHQESRIGKAVEVMIQHVENLRRLYTKEHAELLELRQTMMQNERSFGSHADEFRPKKQSGSQYYKSSTRRVSIPRSGGVNMHLDTCKTQDAPEAEAERLTRRSPWNVAGKGAARPPLKRHSSSWVDPEDPSLVMRMKGPVESDSQSEEEQREEPVMTRPRRLSSLTELGHKLTSFIMPHKTPSPCCSPSADAGTAPCLAQNLHSSRATVTASVAGSSRGLWLWLAMVVVLAGLLAVLASLVMQPAAEAAPVGTGDSWMTIQQLLWPYTGLRHNGQPPV